MTVSPITSTITEGQEKQYKRFVEDAAARGAKLALEQVSLDKDGLQRLLARGDEFITAIAEVIVAKTRELSELPYANEEVSSKRTYPKDFRYRSVEEQVEFWAKVYPDLDATYVAGLTASPVPDGAESYMVMPKPGKLGATYNAALEVVLGLIATSRSFKNWREGELGPDRLRLNEQTRHVLEKLERETPGDFLVIAVQFGKRHLGQSVRRARVCFAGNEFGLGPYEVICMMLMHPERISGTEEEFYVFIAGAEYAPDADGDFSCSLSVYWRGRQLRLAYCDADDANPRCGSSSAFAS